MTSKKQERRDGLLCLQSPYICLAKGVSWDTAWTVMAASIRGSHPPGKSPQADAIPGKCHPDVRLESCLDRERGWFDASSLDGDGVYSCPRRVKVHIWGGGSMVDLALDIADRFLPFWDYVAWIRAHVRDKISLAKKQLRPGHENPLNMGFVPAQTHHHLWVLPRRMGVLKTACHMPFWTDFQDTQGLDRTVVDAKPYAVTLMLAAARRGRQWLQASATIDPDRPLFLALVNGRGGLILGWVNPAGRLMFLRDMSSGPSGHDTDQGRWITETLHHWQTLLMKFRPDVVDRETSCDSHPFVLVIHENDSPDLSSDAALIQGWPGVASSLPHTRTVWANVVEGTADAAGVLPLPASASCLIRQGDSTFPGSFGASMSERPASPQCQPHADHAQTDLSGHVSRGLHGVSCFDQIVMAEESRISLWYWRWPLRSIPARALQDCAASGMLLHTPSPKPRSWSAYWRSVWVYLTRRLGKPVLWEPSVSTTSATALHPQRLATESISPDSEQTCRLSWGVSGGHSSGFFMPEHAPIAPQAAAMSILSSGPNTSFPDTLPFSSLHQGRSDGVSEVSALAQIVSSRSLPLEHEVLASIEVSAQAIRSDLVSPLASDMTPIFCAPSKGLTSFGLVGAQEESLPWNSQLAHLSKASGVEVPKRPLLSVVTGPSPVTFSRQPKSQEGQAASGGEMASNLHIIQEQGNRVLHLKTDVENPSAASTPVSSWNRADPTTAAPRPWVLTDPEDGVRPIQRRYGFVHLVRIVSIVTIGMAGVLCYESYCLLGTQRAMNQSAVRMQKRLADLHHGLRTLALNRTQIQQLQVPYQKTKDQQDRLTQFLDLLQHILHHHYVLGSMTLKAQTMRLVIDPLHTSSSPSPWDSFLDLWHSTLSSYPLLSLPEEASLPLVIDARSPLTEVPHGSR